MVDMLYSEDTKTIKKDARRRYHGIHQRHRKGMAFLNRKFFPHKEAHK